MKGILTALFMILLFGLAAYFLAKPKDMILYGKINDANGLSEGASVFIKGLNVGEVKDLSFDGDSIAITLSLDSDIKLNKASEFHINQNVIPGFGSAKIEIKPKQSDAAFYKSKDIINSKKFSVIKTENSLEDVTKSLNELFDNMSESEINKELQEN